jgi:transcriptional regulator with XRE-family HTH domain
MAFGDRVRAWRETRGFKQAELARRSGLDTATISRIEHGKQANPAADTVQRLATALGITPVELMQDSPVPVGGDGPPLARMRVLGLSAQQIAVVEADWPAWGGAMRRQFLRELDGLDAAQAAVEEARRKLLSLEPVPDTGGPDLPAQNHKAQVGA